MGVPALARRHNHTADFLVFLQFFFSIFCDVAWALYAAAFIDVLVRDGQHVVSYVVCDFWLVWL